MFRQTFGKKDGSGLGLSHARRVVDVWGGTLRIASTEGKGTTVTIDIPAAEAPAWFANKLNIPARGIVVVADDDPAIHALWREKLARLTEDGRSPRMVHLMSGKELLSWYRKFVLSDDPADRDVQVVYFCDYEFPDEEQTGVDLLEVIGARNQAVLITSRWDETAIQGRCERIGIKLLPKQLADRANLSFLTNGDAERLTLLES